MNGMTWVLGDDDLWSLVASDGQAVREGVERPAIGYMQSRLGEGQWDVMPIATDSEEAVQRWKAEIVERSKDDRTIEAVYGEPRILSSAEWDVDELNQACQSAGKLWRMLRKEGLL